MTLKAYTSPNLAGGSIAHGFFTRRGGVSTGIYESLNCGPGSDDDKANVTENRTRAVHHLTGGDKPLATLYQIHSGDVITTNKSFTVGALPKADALVTKTPGLVLGVLTADCAPVLFADREAGVIGAAHAGWRGALAGILENAIKAMEALGARREAIAAAVGPCIALPSYEVGEDFHKPFIAADPGYDKFFAAGQRGKYRFDLEGFAATRLEAAGIVNVARLSLDTYSREEEFFSFRRTCHKKEADYGRQISAICLNAG